ncbi:MAG TPA: cobalamin-dependent protein [archaeon]|nr:cobalamin-dependent protein [archaeon]
MRILLVNPNRYRTPPVMPLGLEHLAEALRQNSSHEARILDLCFADDPSAALNAELERFEPQVAALTVRNIDTTLYNNNVFFLDEIKAMADLLKGHGVPVVLGGAGFSFSPRGVLEYLGAEWGISGPGDKALVHLLDLLETGPPPAGTILNGWQWGADPDLQIVRPVSGIDCRAYQAWGGIFGFETQKGCLANCSYCPEGSGRVIFRNPRRIVEELKGLCELGFTDYHLCDSEFNQDLRFCREFLETLIKSGLSISWALYMKTSPYDEELFRLLKRSGANLVTLSVPSGQDSLAHAAEIRALCAKHGIRLAVDFFSGFPGETADQVRSAIESLRRIRPETVGVNTFIRLIEGTTVTQEVLGSSEHRKYVLGELADNRYLLRPVFYNRITVESLREMIGEDPVFRIEGFERTTNYERLRSSGV